MDAEKIIARAEQQCAAAFLRTEKIEQSNVSRLMDVFSKNKVAQRHFSGSTGYGYDDEGRDALERIWAGIFSSEKALVRPQLMSGTHAIAVALLGNLRPGEEMLAISGKPYDTLMDVIGSEENPVEGSMYSLGIAYRELEAENARVNIPFVLKNLRPETRLVHMQRSRGYAWRRALDIAEIEAVAEAIHAARPDIVVFLDNCYGEFTDIREPRVDLMAGSLIKNPGGGIAPTGGYIAGREKYVQRAAARLSAPGIGEEIGSYEAGYRLFYQGLFLAPHVVSEALKGSILLGEVFSLLGYEVSPAPGEPHGDIIQAVKLGDRETLIDFCQMVQSASPVDAHVLPEPWAMPGYSDEVIMAAGTFVSGASIELSADAPMREPYIVYVQGGLCYAHVRLAALRIVDKMLAKGRVASGVLAGLDGKI